MIANNEEPGGREKSKRKSAAQKSSLDSANHFEVVATQTGATMMSPPMARQVLSRAQALSLAAWLLVMSGCDLDDVRPIMVEIAKK